MLGSLLGPSGTGRRAGPCWVNPDHHDWLESLGLRTADEFLALPGIVVSGHVGRNVSRVEFGGAVAYLKREHRVRARDRFRSWRDGFGRVSVSAREAAVLRRLELHNLPAPRCLAHGAARGQAFLLVQAADATTDLRQFPEIGDGLADRLGRVIARVHEAGVDQPDLFAKHVLVSAGGSAMTILDWQRATIRRMVGWPNRLRGLAALRATTPPAAMTDAAWSRLLREYLAEVARIGDPVPDLDQFRRAVEHAAVGLLRRPAIRAQRLMSAPVRQELVRIGGERVCAIPEVASGLRSDVAIRSLYDQAQDARLMTLPGGRVGRLRVRRYVLPFGRWSAVLRGRSWRSPELQAARLLFHLERHGIPAPKLHAYGQMVPSLAPARSFLLFQALASGPVGRGHATAVRELLDRLHAAGCRLTELGAGGEPFGVAEGAAVVRQVAGLRLAKRVTRRQVERDRARVDAFFRGLG